MSTWTDLARGNFNGDFTSLPGNIFGSVGDLVLFDNFGDKAIWLENGTGGRLATSPNGFNLPFTGPTWHIVAAADFDSANPAVFSLVGNNPTYASDLLWQNDNGDLALWQSTGNNVNPFSGSNQENLPNPGAGWHVASTNDFDGNHAADILFQHDTGLLAVWEFQSFNAADVLQGAPVITFDGLRNVIQNPGATWHVVATGDISGDFQSGIVFQNDNGAIAVWENPANPPGQIVFNIQSNLPNPGPGWHVVGMGNTTEAGWIIPAPGQDIVLQHDNGNIAIWQLQVVGNQVVREGPGGTDPTGFNLGNPGAGWHVVGVHDMDGDSRADILLQNDNNGAAAVWTNIQWTPNTTNGTYDGFFFFPQPNPDLQHLDWHIV
jgi:hypothetical protein